MSFLRRGSPDNEDTSDDEADGPVTTVDVRSRPAQANSPSSTSSAKETEREQKEAVRKKKRADRAAYQELRRQAAKATAAMEDPEPRRGIYVAVAMVGLAALSYFGNDVYPKISTSHGKTVTHWLPITHPETAIIFFVVTLAAAASIRWRRRYVTGIAFFVAGVLGLDTPFPTGLTDLEYLTFAVGAGYFLWVIMFRMNKQKKEWIAANGPKTTRSTSSTSTSSRQPQKKRLASRQPAALPARSRKTKADDPVLSATGRALPANNRRYTRPQRKSRAAQRRTS